MNATVFDLDGTLVDSAPDLAAALAGVLVAEGRTPLGVDAVRGLIGQGARRMLDRAFAMTGGPVEHDVFPAFRRLYRECLAERTRPYPGVLVVLAALRRHGVPVLVCTNKPEDLARDLLVGLGLDVLVDGLVGGDTLPVKKPDPAPVLHALSLVGAPTDGAVMVGDTQADVGAGRAAGLRVIGVTWGYGDIAGADIVATDAAALARALGVS